MALTSGFFPSVNGDRKQTGSFLAQWIHSLISNGVLDGDFAVTVGANMSVILPTGQAWINGYYCRNDGNVTLPIANADGILKRKDTVVLRWDINTRDITVQVLTGVLSSSPIAPIIARSVEQYDLKLAEISIAAGTTVITQAIITDTRLDSAVCGLVTQMIKTIDTTTLFNQLQAYMTEHEAQFTADMAAFETQSSTDFNTWLDGIKEILDESTAANLLNLINTHTARIDNPHAVTAEQTGSIPNTRKVNNKVLSADITLTPTDIGLGSVNNTADINKSVNYAGSSNYANSAGSAPANGGTANYARYSTSDVALTTAALRNELTLTSAPTSYLGLGVSADVIS